MILIDFTQIAIGSLMVAINRSGENADLILVRHLILNGLRYYRTRFSEKYGELIICCDSKHYWRRDYFPNYKANRKKDREATGHDWNEIFSHLNQIRDELKENFPYKVIDVYGSEADDIIAILIKQVHDDPDNIIISSDKDFIQLHGPQVDQYSPVSKKFVEDKDPVNYLREHILKGDRSDGVPNILSSDDTFVEGRRQKPMRKTTLATLTEAMDKSEVVDLYNLAKCPKDTWIRNWQRNETLINLDKIPTDIQDKILLEFENVKVKDRSGLFDYFLKNRLNSLIENIGDF
jgi:hypothetical protein